MKCQKRVPVINIKLGSCLFPVKISKNKQLATAPFCIPSSTTHVLLALRSSIFLYLPLDNLTRQRALVPVSGQHTIADRSGQPRQNCRGRPCRRWGKHWQNTQKHQKTTKKQTQRLGQQITSVELAPAQACQSTGRQWQAMGCTTPKTKECGLSAKRECHCRCFPAKGGWSGLEAAEDGGIYRRRVAAEN